MNSSPKYLFINFLLITFFITKFSFGQKPVFGIKAGIAFANATINQSGTGTSPSKTSARTGALGGIYLDVPLRKELIFRPGAEVVSKGARQKDDYSSYDYPIIFTYIDFPLNILYKKKFTHGYLLAGGGPVIGVPIKDYYGYYSYPLKTEFSVNGLIGYETAIGFSLNLNYTYGLSNASKDKQIISKISNRYLGIALGYSF
jgi:Outer membrane protein beta-barrel domain